MGLKVQLMDIYKRITTFDKKLGVIKNGDDNNYPEIIDRYINNSVTAKSAANIMATYLSGKGFELENELLVNKSLTLQSFTRKLARSLSRQGGAFVHVNYNANYKKVSFDVLPYSHCRIGEKDDNKYNGKIIVNDTWTGKLRREDFNVIDVYNENEKVIEAQVIKAGGWEKYKGQVWYVNLNEDYDYALSPADPVMFDCDSESQSSIFKNKSLRKGFFGKTLIVTKPLIGEREIYPEDGVEYQAALSERKAFKETINNFIGAENVGGALHVELEHDQTNLDDAIKIQQIGSDINDKLFEYTERSVFNNILMAFNNVPSGLIRSDVTMFGNSGEALKEMKFTYQENTTQEREMLEQTINKLLTNFKDFNKKVKIVPLIDEPIKTVEDVNQ